MPKLRRRTKKIKESTLDKAFSLWIRNRDGRCLKCGSRENLQCAHIYSRVARSVRFEPLNALTLCYKCHIGWAHKNPLEFTAFVQAILGDRLFELTAKYHKLRFPLTEKEKEALLKRFKLN